MKAPSFLTKSRQGKQIRTLRDDRRTLPSELPFFFIVTLVLVLIYIFLWLQYPQIRQSGQWALLTLVMIAYIGLFWVPAFMTLTYPRSILYLVVQAALCFVLTLYVNSAALAFGLVAPLIGLAIGVVPTWSSRVVTIALLLATYAVGVSLSVGWTDIGSWILVTLPMTFFIVIYVFLYGRQAEAREEAQTLLQELQHAHMELADYASQVEELTLAAERQRMARELHDTLAQGVAGLILQLEAVDAHLDDGNTSRAQSIVQQAMVRARTTLSEARQAIDDLRLNETHPQDLTAIITAKTERFQAATGISCSCEITIPSQLSTDLQDHIARSVSEMLSNVIQHAKATQVNLVIRSEVNDLCVSLHDNGIGFDPERPIAPGHYGILGLRERARLTGGTLDIASAPGEGTTVRFCMPLGKNGTTQPLDQENQPS